MAGGILADSPAGVFRPHRGWKLKPVRVELGAADRPRAPADRWLHARGDQRLPGPDPPVPPSEIRRRVEAPLAPAAGADTGRSAATVRSPRRVLLHRRFGDRVVMKS